MIAQVMRDSSDELVAYHEARDHVDMCCNVITHRCPVLY